MKIGNGVRGNSRATVKLFFIVKVKEEHPGIDRRIKDIRYVCESVQIKDKILRKVFLCRAQRISKYSIDIQYVSIEYC